jgi:hypothetical protein
MSGIKHTGGVWILDRRDPDRLYVAQQYGDEPGGRICEVFMNCLVREDGREANALLIAAAPELLEAAQTALSALESIANEMTVGDRFTNAGQLLLDALEPCRAAIAKARGE